MLAARRPRGFTLIEVAVVMLLIAIVLSMVGVRLGEDDNSRLREEAKRLAVLLQTAQEEAVLLGKTIAITFESDSYSFSLLTADQSEPFENEILRKRSLPEGMTFSKREIEGAEETEEPPQLPLPATGEVPPFILILKLGEYRWRLEGEFGGEIKSSAPVPAEERV